MNKKDKRDKRDKILPLELREVYFEGRGRQLLSGLNLYIDDISSASIILGHNGAGKSLILKLMHNLFTPSKGEVIWHGERSFEAQKHQSMVFQTPPVLRRSVLGNVVYALSLRGVSRKLRHQRALEALTESDLVSLRDVSADKLSVGQKQLLAIICSWAVKPQVIFLDEPTANLDPKATRSFEILLRKIISSGIKIIMSTHDLAQARRLADEVIFVHEGRLMERSSGHEFFNNPKTTAAARFISGGLL